MSIAKQIPRASLTPLTWISAAFVLATPLLFVPEGIVERTEWLLYLVVGLGLPFALRWSNEEVSPWVAGALRFALAFVIARSVFIQGWRTAYFSSEATRHSMMRLPTTTQSVLGATALVALWYLCRGRFPSLSFTVPEWHRFAKPAVPASTFSSRLVTLFFIAAAAFWAGCFSSRGPSDLHHLSFFIGPVEMIQRGHLLLHDVPSQYGFLSALFPSLLPFKAATSFALEFWAINVASAIVGYTVMARTFPSLPGKVLAAFLAFSATYFLCGNVDWLTGSLSFPSTGPLRFFWVQALTASFLIPPDRLRENAKRTLAMVLFTIGCLWSAESLFYCCSVVLFLWIGKKREGFAFGVRCVGLLALAALAISVYYRLRWGFLPDWFAFIEYAAAYSGGFGALPIAPHSIVWLFLLLYLLTIVGAEKDDALWPIAGLYWGTMSYFISRSHDNNLWNLMSTWLPFAVASVRRPSLESHRWRRWFIATVAYLALTTLVSTWGKVPRFAETLLARSKSFGKDVGPLLVDEDAAVAANPVLRLLPTGQEAALIDLTTKYLPPISLGRVQYRPWLPIYPDPLYKVLSPARRQEYLRRYLERTPTETGYLVWDPRLPENQAVVGELSKLGFPIIPVAEIEEGIRLDRVVPR